MPEPALYATTSVVPRGGGRYRGTVDPSWNLSPLPQGGIVTALALRAMAAELGEPGQTVRTAHTAYVSQVADGPVDIAVDVLRRGRTMSHLRAGVASPERPPGHVTTGVFGTPRDGYSFTDLRPPESVPPPDECRSFREPLPPGVEGFPPTPFWNLRVEGRSALGHAPWEEYVPDRAERAMWYRFDEPPVTDEGDLDPLGLVVLADTMPGAVGERIGRQDRRWFAPSIDLTIHLLDRCHSTWVLAHNRARFAGDGYASADMALWDCGDDGRGAPRLVAYATQLFLFSFMD